MRQCINTSCTNPASNGGDLCSYCANNPHSWPPPTQFPEEASGLKSESVQEVSSGGDNDYWVAHIRHPKRLEAYSAECEDLIEHFQMTFQEGEAFKALWRNGMLRLGQGKPGDSHRRNAQKVRHFGARMEAMEERKAKE